MFRFIYETLHEKPAFGIVGALSSGFAFQTQSMLTDRHTLEIVSGFGVWAGALVAGLTALVWVIKLYDIIKIRIKIKKT